MQLLLALSGLLPCLFPARAVQEVSTYAEAEPIVTADGFILFAYAEDWDSYSKSVCDQLMANAAVRSAAGNAVFMRVPIPNVLTDERKAADKKRFGKINVPDAPNYPALIMLTKTGRHYATVTGPFMRRAKPDKVALLVKNRREAMLRQEELLARAQKATGTERAKLLGEACSVEGPEPPGKLWGLINEIRKLDPKNTTGYGRSLIPPFDLAAEISDIERSKNPGKGRQAALRQAQEYLRSPIYTTAQKQALYAVCIGILHRHGGAKDAATIRKYAAEMAALDKTSMLGKSARAAVRKWGEGFTLAGGWNPAVLQDAANAPAEAEGPLPFTQPGSYTVTFIYERGSQAAFIKAVSLYDGDKLVCEDRHDGTSGLKLINNVYRLTVGSPPHKPRLLIEFNQRGKNDSRGFIKVERSSG